MKKICKNPECKKVITNYKSSKRTYCNDVCKNRKAYLKKTEENKIVFETEKATRKNYSILRKLRALNLGPISEQTLSSHEFNFDALHKTEIFEDKSGKPIQLNRVYDIYFEQKNNQIIIKN